MSILAMPWTRYAVEYCMVEVDMWDLRFYARFHSFYTETKESGRQALALTYVNTASASRHKPPMSLFRCKISMFATDKKVY